MHFGRRMGFFFPKTSFHSQGNGFGLGLLQRYKHKTKEKMRTNKASLPSCCFFCSNMPSHTCTGTAIGVIKDSENKNSNAFQLTDSGEDITHHLFLNRDVFLFLLSSFVLEYRQTMSNSQSTCREFQKAQEVSYFLIAVRQLKIPAHTCNTVHHLSLAYQLMGYILVLCTRALRSTLKLQQPAERCVSRSIGESVN